MLDIQLIIYFLVASFHGRNTLKAKLITSDTTTYSCFYWASFRTFNYFLIQSTFPLFQQEIKNKKFSYKISFFFFTDLTSFPLVLFSLLLLKSTLKMESLKSLHFSPETPFGLPLYPIFEKVYEAVLGQKASDFHYTSNVTPLSTVQEGKLYIYI